MPRKVAKGKSLSWLRFRPGITWLVRSNGEVAARLKATLTFKGANVANMEKTEYSHTEVRFQYESKASK